MPTVIDGTPDSTSAEKRTAWPAASPNSETVDAGHDAERDADGAGQPDQDQRPGDGVAHAAAGLAERHRQVGEELERQPWRPALPT
jgi:hypothetical protein